MPTDAHPDTKPEALLQGGMDNKELREAWGRKLPGVEPTDRDLTAFALGVEVGDAGKSVYFNERNSARDAWRRAATERDRLHAECESLRTQLAEALNGRDAYTEAAKRADDDAIRWATEGVQQIIAERDAARAEAEALRADAEAADAALIEVADFFQARGRVSISQLQRELRIRWKSAQALTQAVVRRGLVNGLPATPLAMGAMKEGE